MPLLIAWLGCVVHLCMFTTVASPSKIATATAGWTSRPQLPALPSTPSARDGNTLTRTWVFFTDKGQRAPAELAAALDQLATTYDQRALQRRASRGNNTRRSGQLVDQRDLPVSAAYLAAIAATGAKAVVTSRWLNAVSVRATPDELERIAALPCVQHLQPVARAWRTAPTEHRPAAAAPARDDAGRRGGLDYGYATDQLTQINLIALHDAGYTGQGVVIGVLDTGFHRTHAAFNDPAHPLNILAEWDFINNDGNTDNEAGDPAAQKNHGTWILGTMGSYLPGQLVGGAFDASFILCKTEVTGSETPIEEDYYVAGLEFIEANGADVATSSLGYSDWYTQENLDGQTAVTTLAVNVATANGLHCCTSAGNAGHDDDPTTSHLGAPADAFQVITCGAVRANGYITSFSSDGPTADGRVKPELLAQGYDTATVDPDDDSNYEYVDGTSLSTPLVAATVACLTQAHPEWTVDELRAFLFHSAQGHGTYDPLYVRGYGIVNAYSDCNGNGTWDATDLANGTSADCNANLLPDECDITFGTSFDTNGNGVPDECELCPGDLNCDAVVDFLDINAFVLYLSNFPVWRTTYAGCDERQGDIDGNGDYPSFADINPFVTLLSTNSLPLACDNR